MTLRSAAKMLLVLALALPVVQTTLAWVAGLLTSMGDPAGADIVRHVATVFAQRDGGVNARPSGPDCVAVRLLLSVVQYRTEYPNKRHSERCSRLRPPAG